MSDHKRKHNKKLMATKVPEVRDVTRIERI
ncbi:hypothetical protein XELAEV_180378472mg, partial [Xenopus laevis]